MRPLVIAHRGASGYRPEHTLAAYELAVEQGADYIEPDLVMTRDGVLVDRHEPEMSGTTDVADRREFASRHCSKVVDGHVMSGWFAEDFTLEELKTLRAIERVPDLRPGNTAYDGRFEVPTYEEVLRLRERLSREHGRDVGVIPEIKHSTYLHSAGLDPEAAVVELTARYGLNTVEAPMWIQSFEWGNLVDLRERCGYVANLVLLTTHRGGPFDLAGRRTSYADLLTPAGLARLADVVDGLGPEKEQVIPRTGEGTLAQPSSLVGEAHAAGLKVIPWTFRAENTFLPPALRSCAAPAMRGKLAEEIDAHLRAGIDGFFTDHPDLAVAARDRFVARH